jgi:hypothetical protein
MSQPQPQPQPTDYLSTSTSKASVSVSLPLDWTRVQRRSGTNVGSSTAGKSSSNANNTTRAKRTRSSTATDTENEDCTDVTCRRCSSRGVPAVHDTVDFEDVVVVEADDMNENTTTHVNNNNNCNNTLYSGKVIFCLPDPDYDWFQGYYFPFDSDDLDAEDADHFTKNDLVTSASSYIQRILQNNNDNNYSKHNQNQLYYYGILCHVQPDIDECLQCTAGGYREISSMEFTLMRYKDTAASIQPIVATSITTKSSTTSAQPAVQSSPPPTKLIVSNVTWLGGDMMKLYKNNTSTSTTNASKITTKTHSSTATNKVTHGVVSTLHMQTSTFHCTTTGSSTSKATINETMIRYLQKYFPSLIRQLRQAIQLPNEVTLSSSSSPSSQPTKNDPTDDAFQHDIQQLMPNVAIAVGTMDIWLSS